MTFKDLIQLITTTLAVMVLLFIIIDYFETKEHPYKVSTESLCTTDTNKSFEVLVRLENGQTYKVTAIEEAK